MRGPGGRLFWTPLLPSRVRGALADAIAVIWKHLRVGTAAEPKLSRLRRRGLPSLLGFGYNLCLAAGRETRWLI
jgi:hypothetical protein